MTEVKRQELPDYLHEVLRKNLKPSKNISKLNNQGDIYIDLYNKDISKIDKIEIIKAKTEALELKAKLYETGVHKDNLDDQSDVN